MSEDTTCLFNCTDRFARFCKLPFISHTAKVFPTSTQCVFLCRDFPRLIFQFQRGKFCTSAHSAAGWRIDFVIRHHLINLDKGRSTNNRRKRDEWWLRPRWSGNCDCWMDWITILTIHSCYLYWNHIIVSFFFGQVHTGKFIQFKSPV